MKEFSYVIKDSMGIHARPAGLLVKCAAGFKSDIKIGTSAKEVDAKRIMGVMGLGVKTGENVKVTANGKDEDKAITELKAFFTANL